MLEIKIVTDMSRSAELCHKSGIEDASFKNVMAACDGEEVIAWSVFTLCEDSMTVLSIVPQDDVMMFDGILRSTLHVAASRGLSVAYYADGVSADKLSLLGFIKNEQEKTLRIEKLFEACCCEK